MRVDVTNGRCWRRIIWQRADAETDPVTWGGGIFFFSMRCLATIAAGSMSSGGRMHDLCAIAWLAARTVHSPAVLWGEWWTQGTWTPAHGGGYRRTTGQRPKTPRCVDMRSSKEFQRWAAGGDLPWAVIYPLRFSRREAMPMDSVFERLERDL